MVVINVEPPSSQQLPPPLPSGMPQTSNTASRKVAPINDGIAGKKNLAEGELVRSEEAQENQGRRGCCTWVRSHPVCATLLILLVAIVIAVAASVSAVVLAGKDDNAKAQTLRSDALSGTSSGALSGTYYSNYQVEWSAENQSGCSMNSARPILIAKCAKFLELPVDDRSSCIKTSDNTARCNADKSVNNKASLRCVGNRNDNLGLDVSVKEGGYTCTKMLNYEGVGTVQRWTYGGTADHKASIKVQSRDGWASTNEVCLHKDATKQGGGGCKMSKSCRVGHACGCYIHCVCSGAESCTANIPLLRMTAFKDQANPHAVLATGGPGDSCTFDSSCQSGICAGGKCSDGPLGDGAVCEVDRHCSNGKCAKYGKNELLLCCPSGSAIDEKCTNQPPSSPCNLDSLCQSGICVKGICKESEQLLDDDCQGDHHCKSKICIQGICKARLNSALEVCSKDKDCEDEVCGLHGSDGLKRCCPSSDSIMSKGKKFCTNQEEGAGCGESNRVCNSSLCIVGKCRDETLSPYEQCNNNSDCSSKACAIYSGKKVCCPTSSKVQHNGKHFCKVDKGKKCSGKSFCLNNSACARETWTKNSPRVCCQSGQSAQNTRPDARYSYEKDYYCTGQDAGDPCGNNNGLCSNKACARKVYASNAQHVCCPSGKEVEALVPNNKYSYETDWFCTGMTMGASCRINSQCASRICVKGKCKDGPQPAGSPCDEKGDCTNKVCAKELYQTNSKKVCCPSGESVQTLKVNARYSYEKDVYCTSTPAGSPCNLNSQCAGTCVNKKCVGGRLPSSSTCDDNADCANGVCGLEKYSATATRMCCPSNKRIEIKRPDARYSYETDFYCTGQDAGDPCGNSNNLCTNGACARKMYASNAQHVCCPSGKEVEALVPNNRYSYETDWYCTGMTQGANCRINTQCKSGTCADGKCK